MVQKVEKMMFSVADLTAKCCVNAEKPPQPDIGGLYLQLRAGVPPSEAEAPARLAVGCDG